MLSYSVDSKAPQELWNPLSKAVPGKFHGSGRHSQCICAQDWANFQVSGMANCYNFRHCNGLTSTSVDLSSIRHCHIQLRAISIQWHHNEPDGISNHWRLHCLLTFWFRHRSKKISKLRVTGLRAGNSPMTGEFPHKGPVTRKIFPFNDIIMSTNTLKASKFENHTFEIGTRSLRGHWVKYRS